MPEDDISRADGQLPPRGGCAVASACREWTDSVRQAHLVYGLLR